MGSVFKRRRKWYVKYKHPTKGWITRSAETENEGEARSLLEKIEKAIRARKPVEASEDLAPATVARASSPRMRDLVESWLGDRRSIGQRNVDNEEAHFRVHILPEFGHRPVGDISTKEIRLFVKKLWRTAPAPGKGPGAGVDAQAERVLAPRTVRKIYGTLRTFFGDLVADEFLKSNPCKLAKRDLPKNIDKDPEWRSQAIFTSAEVVALIASGLIDQDRRVLNAILFLTGMRLGEVLGLRFSHIERDTDPLQRITVARSYDARTKTDAVRVVPMHPRLAAILAQWRLSGYAALVGRPPREDDFVIPGIKVSSGHSRVVSVRRDRQGDIMMRDRHRVRKDWLPDLEALGLRHRRVHDARRAFITIARESGADDRVLKRITHTPPESMLDIYSTFPWPTMCKAVQVIDLPNGSPKVERRER